MCLYSPIIAFTRPNGKWQNLFVFVDGPVKFDVILQQYLIDLIACACAEVKESAGTMTQAGDSTKFLFNAQAASGDLSCAAFLAYVSWPMVKTVDSGGRQRSQDNSPLTSAHVPPKYVQKLLDGN